MNDQQQRDWIEVKLKVDGEAAEAIAEVLHRYGHQGVSIEQLDIMPESIALSKNMIVRAYIPADDHAPEAQLQLETALGHMNMMYPIPRPEYSIIHAEDWAEAWKAHYHPLRIGRQIIVRPVWIEQSLQPNDIEIALDPGMAFGTGTHPTTQLCLEALEDVVQQGIRVLDLGCGSGILSIAAAKFGAASVLGLDIDPLAVHSAEENIKKNHVAKTVIVQQGSLENILSSSRRFDLIMVNILARIIIPMCEQGLGQVVRPGGTAVFSGLIEEQINDVEAALHKTSLAPYKYRQQGDWIAIEAKRPH